MPSVFCEQPMLPHPALFNADWADRYAVIIPLSGLSALKAAQIALDRPPRWVGRLLAMRNMIVAPFGLRSAAMPAGQAGSVGAFPIVSERNEQVVLGFDDKHLDFRIVIDVAAGGESGTKVSVTTLVQRHNIFGRLYILVVTPFHKLIVRTTLARFFDPALVTR